jgi:hypothetical protein
MPQRLRRLGTASAAVSAGALVLLLAAPASEAAAADTCKKGTDPASTIENWKCNLGNLRKSLTPTPTPTPTPTEQTKKKVAPKTSAPKTSKAPARGSGGAASTPSGQGAGSGPSAMTGGAGLKPYDDKAPSLTSGLPGVLPTPEIAADPNAYQGTPGAVPQTRLIAPVASSQHENDQMLWVAAAAGAAGAVAALNISVAGRSLRRSAAARRR